MLETLANLLPVSHGRCVSRQNQCRTHQWFAEFFQQRERNRMIRHADAYRATSLVLQTARRFSRRRQQKRVSPRRASLQQPKLPRIHFRVATDLPQVATDQREVMVTIRLPNAPDTLQGVL